MRVLFLACLSSLGIHNKTFCQTPWELFEEKSVLSLAWFAVSAMEAACGESMSSELFMQFHWLNVLSVLHFSPSIFFPAVLHTCLYKVRLRYCIPTNLWTQLQTCSDSCWRIHWQGTGVRVVWGNRNVTSVSICMHRAVWTLLTNFRTLAANKVGR